MATSSFDKHFVVKDPKAIKILINALQSPIKVVLPKKDLEKEEKEALCAIKKRLASMDL